MHVKRKQTPQDGITLLITLLLMGVLLGVSTSLLNVTIKQLQLSGIAFASETAFQAADSGMECIVQRDFEDFDPESSPFYIAAGGKDGSGKRIFNDNDNKNVKRIECFGEFSDDLNVNAEGEVASSEGNNPGRRDGEQLFQFNLNISGNGGNTTESCVRLSVYKFYDSTDQVDMYVDGREMREGGCPAGAICTVVQSRGYNVACDDINSGGRVVEREYTQVY